MYVKDVEDGKITYTYRLSKHVEDVKGQNNL